MDEAYWTAFLNLTNEGTVQVNVDANASDTAAWTIENAPGHNQFNMSFYGAISPSAWELLGTGTEDFKDDLPASGQPGNYTTFDLKVYMPTSSSTNDLQYLTVTFTATAD